MWNPKRSTWGMCTKHFDFMGTYVIWHISRFVGGTTTTPSMRWYQAVTTGHRGDTAGSGFIYISVLASKSATLELWFTQTYWKDAWFHWSTYKSYMFHIDYMFIIVSCPKLFPQFGLARLPKILDKVNKDGTQCAPNTVSLIICCLHDSLRVFRGKHW